MSSFSYVAVGPTGIEARGQLDVADQSEALRRIREMGLFPTRITNSKKQSRSQNKKTREVGVHQTSSIPGFHQKVKPRVLNTFTRQLATLVEAGMPLLRGLSLLGQQAEHRVMKQVIAAICLDIENGSSLTEALKAHPRIFNPLYVNMVKAGEIGGALDVTLTRLAEFMEKSQRIKGKVKAALFYPCAVMLVAGGVLTLLMTFVVPKFKMVFDGLMGGLPLPRFTVFVFKLSELLTHHLVPMAILLGAMISFVAVSVRTDWGRLVFDKFKLLAPILGPVFRKAAIARFARTLGTLIANGVPILQALSIVKETVGNVVVGNVVSRVHDDVKQGDAIAPTLKSSTVFPVMIAGMVDVGEQTGALPEMLMKIADGCDDEVDNATTAMTSLLEPILIVFLAIVVGSIVIAMFLPIIYIINGDFGQGGGENP